MEENYWKYVFETNIEAYLNLWHDDFTGCPRACEAPVGKKTRSRLENNRWNGYWFY